MFTPLKGCTGFEAGSIEIITAANRNRAYILTTPVHSGTYVLHLDSGYNAQYGWARFPVAGTPSELYVGVWVRPDGNYYGEIGFYVTSGHYVGLRHDGTYWDAYVDGSKVADGTCAHAGASWHLVELHVIVGDSGTIESRVDGVVDITYSGDTKPGATTAISYVRLYQYVTGLGNDADSYWDDFTMGTGGWPGDIRYASALVPNADTAQKDWTPSTGVDNYAMVDEKPPSDADYVSAGSVNFKDLYTLSNWSAGANEEPRFIVDWVRAKKDVADSCFMEYIVKSGSTESSSGSFALTTDFVYYGRVLDNDPDTAAEWTANAINALDVGQMRS